MHADHPCTVGLLLFRSADSRRWGGWDDTPVGGFVFVCPRFESQDEPLYQEVVQLGTAELSKATSIPRLVRCQLKAALGDRS